IAYDHGDANTVDPLGGSFFVASLTDEHEKSAVGNVEQNDVIGGAAKAIEVGFMQDEIPRATYDHQLKIESREQIVVGVNRFVEEESRQEGLFRVEDQIRQLQVQKLQALKKERAQEKVTDALMKLKEAARNGQNTMPFILDAVESYATLGEIANVLRGIFGEFRQ